MKAMILAAGKGTRLGRITQEIPKALVDVNGKTLLRRAVEKCSSSGFDDIIVNIHHLASMVEKEIHKLKKEGFQITVSDEREMLYETAGGLFKARDFFNSDPFLLYNVDIVTDLDLTQLYTYHLKNDGLATLAVRVRKGARMFLVNSEGLLCGWKNKNTGEKIVTRENQSLSEIAFSGIHIIDPVIFKFMDSGINTMTSVYIRLSTEHRIHTWRHDRGYWANVGTPLILEEIRSFLKEHENHERGVL